MRPVSDRPLWVIALMFSFHLVWLAFCVLWVPHALLDPLVQRFGRPGLALVVAGVFFAIAFVPLVASCFTLGREYWDLLGRGGPARLAGLKLAGLGVLCVLVAGGLHVFA